MPLEVPPPFMHEASAKPRGNPDQAVEAEFNEAMAARSAQRWLLFIQRHPTHRLTSRAVAERDRLLRQGRD